MGLWQTNANFWIMAEKNFQSLFEYPIIEFKNHLLIENNDRIIFSGRFGIGKTSFLKHFFHNLNQLKIFGKEQYEVFHLFPTNYSVCSNEDITRYFKYDLILEFLKKNIDFETLELDLNHLIPLFTQRNADKIIATLIYMIPKVGKEITDCWSQILKLKEQFSDFKSTITETQGDHLINYLNKIEQIEGSIYENDIITKIINQIISNIKRDSKAVLIIDDLDRIDPEHIFRIFNIFAAYFEATEKNKFGFDKVILVCDCNNIRNIFHNRYGSSVDFTGYIDKFYSNEIFQFDNKKALIEIIQRIFYETPVLTYIPLDFVQTKLFEKNGFLALFTEKLIEQNQLSLRALLRLSFKNLSYIDTPIYFDENLTIHPLKIKILAQIKFLKDLFGDYSHFKIAINHLKSSIKELDNYEHFIKPMLYILSYKEHFFERSTYNFLLFDKPFDFTIAYVDNGDIDMELTKVILNGTVTEYNFSLSEFWDVVDLFIEILNKKNYIA
jgi:CRISPR/Cas system CMR-associated protein Cmr5 small subunit